EQEKEERAARNDAGSLPVRLPMKREPDQLHRMGERIEQADIIEFEARLPDAPQRIESGGGEEHRKDHEVHDARKILKLLDEGREQKAERTEHQPRKDQRRKNGEIADGWRFH